MASRQVALVEYASPDLVPAGLKRVAIVSGSGRADLQSVTPVWVTNPSLGPADVPCYGAVVYASRNLVPAGLLVLDAEGVAYLMRDLFTTDLAAGAINGTAAEPGPDTRTVVDSENKLTIAGSKVVVAGGLATPTFGDPRMAYGARTRQAGRGVLFDYTPHNVPTTGAYAGWSSNLNPTAATHWLNSGYRLGDSSTARLSLYDGTTLFAVSPFTQDSTYRLGVVLQATGAYFLARGGHFGSLPSDVYALLYPVNAGNSATLYPAWMNHNAIFDYADVSVVDLTASRWTGADALTYAASASPAANATLSTLPESVVALTWTPGAGETLELSWKYQDADNRWYLSCAQAAGTIKLYWVSGGVATEVDAGKTQTWTVATPYRIVVVDGLREIRTFVGNVPKHTITPAAAVAHYNSGVYTIKTSLAGSTLQTFPRYVHLLLGEGQRIDLLDRAYTARAAAALTTPTYDLSGEAVHPDVYDAGSGQTWNGHRYWMAMTPYPADNSDFENPSILVSDDGTTWAVPAGLTNPVIAAPGGGAYNADPDLTMVGSTLWMVYRVSAAPDVVHATSSVDGVNWSAPVTLFTDTHAECLSPAVCWDGSQFVMLTVNDATASNTIERRTASAITGPWSAPATVSITLPGSQEPWHLDVISDGGSRLFALINSVEAGLFLCLSEDSGLTWTMPTRSLLPNATGGWDNNLYRACLVRTATGFDCWYSAHDAPPAPYAWRIGFTRIGY